MPMASSIGTPDGYFLKTHKSKELDGFTMPSDAKTLNVEDGNTIFSCMKEVPTTFKQICEKIYDVSIVEKSDLHLPLTCTRKILSRTWKGQAVVVVKKA